MLLGDGESMLSIFGRESCCKAGGLSSGGAYAPVVIRLE
jgi:hypothetical protein